MVARLYEVDSVLADDVNDPMLLRETAGPSSRSQVLEGLRLTDSLKGITKDRFDQVECAQGDLSIGFDPEPQILEKLRLKDR